MSRGKKRRGARYAADVNDPPPAPPGTPAPAPTGDASEPAASEPAASGPPASGPPASEPAASEPAASGPPTSGPPTSRPQAAPTAPPATGPDAAAGPPVTDALARRYEELRRDFEALRAEVGRAIVGHEDLLTDVLAAIFCRGHVLLEGVPGLGKTYLVRTLSRVFDLQFGRVQCTPDLMPSDILGTHIIGEEEGRRVLRFERGPVFANLLLVDEINRATPKTQAALLEVMQERTVTAAGERLELPSPFFVLATQNPVEMEGTYPLPEAQLDRFLFKLLLEFPSHGELLEISRRTSGFAEPELQITLTADRLAEHQMLLTEVPVPAAVEEYAASLILATHPQRGRETSRAHPVTASVESFVAYGASPRGMQALIRAARLQCLLAGRTAVSLADIQRVALPSLRHRLLLNFEGEAEGVDTDAVLRDVLRTLPRPSQEAA